jgi:hypothetical protein
MDSKFNELFIAWVKTKAYAIIPTSETYDKILSVLQEKANGTTRKLNTTERKWLSK